MPVLPTALAPRDAALPRVRPAVAALPVAVAPEAVACRDTLGDPGTIRGLGPDLRRAGIRCSGPSRPTCLGSRVRNHAGQGTRRYRSLHANGCNRDKGDLN